MEEIVSIKEHLFDHDFMANIWESRCMRAGLMSGCPSIIGSLLTDIEKWFHKEGFPEIKLYYSFAIHMWATGYGEGEVCKPRLSQIPPIYTNNDLIVIQVESRHNYANQQYEFFLYVNTEWNMNVGRANIAPKFTYRRERDFILKLNHEVRRYGEGQIQFGIESALSGIRPELMDPETRTESIRLLKQRTPQSNINVNIWMDVMAANSPNIQWYRSIKNPQVYGRDGYAIAAANAGVATLSEQVAELTKQVFELSRPKHQPFIAPKIEPVEPPIQKVIVANAEVVEPPIIPRIKHVDPGQIIKQKVITQKNKKSGQSKSRTPPLPTRKIWR